MHGRIVRYLNSNGKGVVINASKMLFDFNKKTWHDKKVMPMVGMYVEFRCNEAQQITDCKVSKFQEFGGHTMISEADFWRYDSDEELLALQSNARDAMVQKIYKSTDYTKLKEVPLTIKLVDTIRNYFHQEFLAISFLNDLPLPSNSVIFDYAHLKRFGVKALDHLLFNDKTIAKDDFIEELSVMTRLDSALQDFSRYVNVSVKNIFEEYFLRNQCHYQALLTALTNTKDSQNLSLKRIHSFKSDILLLERKIQANLLNNTQKLQKIKAELENMQKAEIYYGKLFVHLNTIKERFEEHYFKLFSELYQKVYARIYKKVKSGLDICMTILDDKIYYKTINSIAFSKNFFKANENTEVPNVLYFAEQYIGHLNKDHLNPRDAQMYRYIDKIYKNYRKHFLIVTTNEKRATELKIKILSQNKFNVVKIASKNTIFFTLINEIHFERIYIDQDNTWKPPGVLIEEAKAHRKNANSRYALLPSLTKENRFGFSE